MAWPDGQDYMQQVEARQREREKHEKLRATVQRVIDACERNASGSQSHSNPAIRANNGLIARVLKEALEETQLDT